MQEVAQRPLVVYRYNMLAHIGSVSSFEVRPDRAKWPSCYHSMSLVRMNVATCLCRCPRSSFAEPHARMTKRVYLPMQVWSLNTAERFDGRQCWRKNVDLSPCPGLEALTDEHAEDWLASPLVVRWRLHKCL